MKTRRFLFGALIVLGGVMMLIPTLWAMMVYGRSQQLAVITPITDGGSSLVQTATSSQVTPIANAPVPTPQDGVSVLFLGDIMLDRSVKIRSVRAGSRSYPFLGLPTGWIESFDYAVANLEGPVTDARRPPEKEIDFQFDPEVIPALQQTGIDAFSQANNHALDQGSAGYQDSVNRLRNAGFLVFGHQVQDGVIAVATTTIRGETFAFLGWNTPDNPLDRTQAKQAIELAKAQAQYVIAFIHWGPEYKDYAHSIDVDNAHWLIDEGVDVVIGGHPHWVQGMSTYKGKPIAWSLGNFVFDQDFSLRTKQGLAVGLTFTENRVRFELFPMSIEKSQPKLEEGDAKTKRLEQLSEISDANLREAIRSGVVEFEL